MTQIDPPATFHAKAENWSTEGDHPRPMSAYGLHFRLTKELHTRLANCRADFRKHTGNPVLRTEFIVAACERFCAAIESGKFVLGSEIPSLLGGTQDVVPPGSSHVWRRHGPSRSHALYILMLSDRRTTMSQQETKVLADDAALLKAGNWVRLRGRLFTSDKVPIPDLAQRGVVTARIKGRPASATGPAQEPNTWQVRFDDGQGEFPVHAYDLELDSEPLDN